VSHRDIQTLENNAKQEQYSFCLCKPITSFVIVIINQSQNIFLELRVYWGIPVKHSLALFIYYLHIKLGQLTATLNWVLEFFSIINPVIRILFSIYISKFCFRNNVSTGRQTWKHLRKPASRITNVSATMFPSLPRA
jgi:hypothetical protein